MMSRYAYRAFHLALATATPLFLAVPLSAQDCTPDRRHAWLGIGTFYCQGGVCKVRGAMARSGAAGRADAERVVRSPYHYDFSVEPSLWRVDTLLAGGRIRDGDVLVAVNGHPITTVRASAELENLAPGKVTRLTVRRDGRARVVPVIPALSCRAVSVGAGSTAAPLELGVADRRNLVGAALRDRARLDSLVAASRRPPVDARQEGPGLLGLAIRCADCVLVLANEAEGARFRFEEYPHVAEVVWGGLAYQAGLRPGDLLTHINGLDLRTKEGAHELAQLTVAPGGTVEIRYRRDGTEQTGSVVRER